MAIATRPQLGSAPCTAVFTSGELTIALATRLACSSSAAPSTRTSISFVGALAVAGDLLGQRQGDVVQRRPRTRRGRPAPAAPLASTMAVSLVDVSVSMRDAVERAVDHPPEDRVEIVGGDCGVGEEQGDQRGHVRLDHADALGHADDAAPPSRRRRPRRPWRTVSVVMIAGGRPASASSSGSGAARAAMPARTRSIG